MHNVKVTNVLLAVHDNTGTTHVTTASDHNQVSRIKLNDAGDLVLGEVEPDGVIHLDKGIGITNCTTVMGNNIGDASVAESNLLYLEELVGRLFSGDLVDNKAALDIVQQAEVLVRLLDGEHIYQQIRITEWNMVIDRRTHETCGIRVISADLAIHLDQALLNNRGNFATSQGILQPVAEEDGKRE